MSWEENSIEGFGIYGVYFNIDNPPDNFNYDDVLSYASNNEFFYYYLSKLKVVGTTECEYINVY